jgi:hypothetical protein
MRHSAIRLDALVLERKVHLSDDIRNLFVAQECEGISSFIHAVSEQMTPGLLPTSRVRHAARGRAIWDEMRLTIGKESWAR